MSQNSVPFNTLDLSELLLNALQKLDYQFASPIQAECIPWMLQGRHVIGQAQTGTGKTAAFSLPILEKLDAKIQKPQALVLAPTRELAIQVAENIEKLGQNTKALHVAVICGGQDYRTQISALKQGANVVVGTPGRILDHLEKGTLKLDAIKTFVLDEADEMLRMGFIEDVETILKALPEEKQMALFSATMPPRIRQIAKQYLNDPVSIEIKSETATVKSIEQQFLFASGAQKPDALLRLLTVTDYQAVIVFVRTKSSADEVAQFLQENGLQAMPIHGDLSQALRERMINQFKQGTIQVLVATDVAARGLDVDKVTHVINYDMPQDCETYVHRIGRTGRAGRSGNTILFITPRESRMLNVLERHTRQKIEKIGVPSDESIQKVMQQRLLSKIQERISQTEKLQSHKDLLETWSQEHQIAPMDLAAALSLLLNQDKAWKTRFEKSKFDSQPSERKPKNFADRSSAKLDFGRRNKTDNFRSDRGPDRAFGKGAKGKPSFDQEQELYRLDVGSMHGVKAGNIVGAIANESGLQSRSITGLKIHDYHSTVYLPKGMSKNIMSELANAWVCGRQLKLTRHDAVSY